MQLKNINGKWYAEGEVNGKFRRRTTGFPVDGEDNRRAAKRRVTEIELAIRSGDLGWAKKVPTLKEYWKKVYEKTYTDRKRAPRLDRQMMAHVLPVLGESRMDDITKSDCERYLNMRRASSPANPGRQTTKLISEGTVQRERSFLHAVFQQAVEDDILAKNPWRKIEKKSYEVRDRVVTEEEQADYVPRLSRRFQRFFYFLLGTGVRLDECRGIVPDEDIDLDRLELRVQERLNEAGKLTTRVKFGKSRTVPIPVELVPIIQEQLDEDGELWTQTQQRLREVLGDACKARKAVIGRVSRRGHQVQAVEGRRAIPTITPHTLRHTFGHRWLTGGGRLEELSRVLGHSSIGVTERHYAHLLKEDLGRAGSRVNLRLGLQRPGARVLALAQG